MNLFWCKAKIYFPFLFDGYKIAVWLKGICTLLILERNNCGHITMTKLLELDMNTWYHISVKTDDCSQLKKRTMDYWKYS